MLTIKHYPNGDVSVLLDDSNFVLSEQSYLMGNSPPNYPVPALPLRDLEYIYIEAEFEYEVNRLLKEMNIIR